MVVMASVETTEDACTMERHLIALHRAMGADLVNGTDGGEGVVDRTGAVARKIGAAHRGKLVSLETRLRMSETRRGRKLSEAHKKSLRRISEETALQMIERYASGASSTDIANQFGVSCKGVMGSVLRFGIKMRTRPDALKISSKKPEFLEKMKRIGDEVASLPKHVRRQKFTAPSKLLPPDTYDTIRMLHLTNPSWSYRKIAREVGTSHGVVSKNLKKMAEEQLSQK